MGNKDKTKLNQNIASERDRSLNQMNQFYGELQSERPGLRAQDQAERAAILDRANQQFTGTSGMSQADRDYLRSKSEYKPTFGPGWAGGEQPESGGGGGGGDGESGDGGGGGGIGGIGGIAPPPLYARSDAGYEEFAGTGGVNIGRLEESLGGFRELADKTGGFDAGRLANIEGAGKGYQGIADTGGFTPEGMSNLRRGVESLRDYGRTGGIGEPELAGLRGIGSKLETLGGQGMTPEDIATFRGTGFKNFADTGGFTPGEINMMRSRSNAAIPAMYNAEMQNLEGRRNIQGGYAPGADALRGRLLRQRGQDIAGAARDTELGISEQVRAGKQYGITGMAGQEKSLQEALNKQRETQSAALRAAGEGGLALESQLAQNRLAGITGAQTAEQGLEQQTVANKLAGLGGVRDTNLDLQNAINQSRVSGLQGIQKTNYDAQSLVQGGRLAGLQGMMQVDQARQQAAEAEAANAAARYAADSAAGSASAARTQAQAEYDANMQLKYNQLGSANELSAQELMQKDRLAGMGSAQELYGQVGGQLSQNDQMRFNAANATSGQQQGLLGQQFQAAQLPGAWDRVMDIANAGIGAVGAVYGAPKKPAGGNTGTAPRGGYAPNVNTRSPTNLASTDPWGYRG